eukprot:7391756-Prymnesium_polylepis.2
MRACFARNFTGDIHIARPRPLPYCCRICSALSVLPDLLPYLCAALSAAVSDLRSYTAVRTAAWKPLLCPNGLSVTDGLSDYPTLASTYTHSTRRLAYQRRLLYTRPPRLLTALTHTHGLILTNGAHSYTRPRAY